MKRFKSQIFESSEQTTREDIIISRLAYLAWVLDNTKDQSDRTRIQNIYNALENVTFDTNGKLRSLEDTAAYIKQTMQDNQGLIPGLPDEDQIEEIDQKLDSFKELHPDVYDKYVRRIKESNLDKHSSGKEDDDQAGQILNPDTEKDEKSAKKTIDDLTDIYGFTNIIGLEPEKKPSDLDKNLKKEIKQAKNDKSLMPTIDSEEKVKGDEESKEGPEKSSDESEKSKEGSEESEEKSEETDDNEENIINNIML